MLKGSKARTNNKSNQLNLLLKNLMSTGVLEPLMEQPKYFICMMYVNLVINKLLIGCIFSNMLTDGIVYFFYPLRAQCPPEANIFSTISPGVKCDLLCPMS
uniref:Uncharacterized protein n=1 Tax=Cacopsylla melanoneura TaxID=428564 RepID=A0A8D9EWW2_9HEMI